MLEQFLYRMKLDESLKRSIRMLSNCLSLLLAEMHFPTGDTRDGLKNFVQLKHTAGVSGQKKAKYFQ